MLSDHIVIVGNGPSAAELSEALSAIPDPKVIVRLNFFFLEEDAPYGNEVDYYFWAVNRARLHDELRKTLREEKYTIENFMCPVPIDTMDYSDGKVGSDPFWGSASIEDHWATIADLNPALARVFMSRPLPTVGLQALAYFACKGYRNIHLFGLDFYQSTDKRYAYEIPQDIAKDLGAKHTTPGYEAGAHSLDRDLDFLRQILAAYPDLNISYNGYFDQVSQILSEARNASDQETSAAAGRAMVQDLTGALTDRSSFTKLERAVVNANERVLELEKKLTKLGAELASAKQSSSEVNAALYRLFATEGMPYSDVVWVVHEMSSLAGVHRPLSAFLDCADQRKQARQKLINLSDKNRSVLRHTMDYIQSRTHRLVLNSVACFEDARVAHYVERATHKAIYLHETEWTLTEFARKNRNAYVEFVEFLKDATVFCVSEKQRKYVEENFETKKTVLVYNTVDTILDSRQRKIRQKLALPKPASETLRIGMVGSFQARKGSQLFAEVAKELKDAMPGVSFEWVGKKHDGIINKELITFHGPMAPQKTQQFIEGLDVLFLPSFDDPQPLAALEALSRGVKLVCYDGIGTAEWAKGVAGFETFEEYTAEAAVSALQQAITSEFDYAAVDTLLSQKFDPDVFTDTMCKALDDMTHISPTASTTSSAVQRHFKSIVKSKVLSLAEEPERTTIWHRVQEHVEELRADLGNTRKYCALAQLLSDHEEQELAEQVIQSGLKRNPGKASMYREAAVFYQRLGNMDQALHHARRAAESNPDSHAAKKVLTQIEADLATSSKSA